MSPRLSSLTTLLSFATIVAAIPPHVRHLRNIQARATIHQCGSHLPPGATREKEKAFNAIRNQKTSSGEATDPVESFTVPVYFNVIYADDGSSGGNIPWVTSPFPPPDFF